MSDLKVYTYAELDKIIADEDAKYLERGKTLIGDGTVIEQVGTWVVTDYGLECLVREYTIAKDRLYEDEPDHGWMFHMAGKKWVDMGDFGDALQRARFIHDPQRKTWPKNPTRAPMPPKLRFSILKRDGYRCRICGATADETRLHVDHRVPVAAGGTTTEDNCWTLCAECNHGKGIRPL